MPIPRPPRRFEHARIWWWLVCVAIVIFIATLIYFNFENMMVWMAFNNPFQSQWAAVQLTDGEVVYGHLAGVSANTIGLTDVYMLDKVTEQSGPQPVGSSTDFVLGGTSGPQVGQAVIPVNYTAELFIQRSAVIYFQFVQPDDPAMPYLR